MYGWGLMLPSRMTPLKPVMVVEWKPLSSHGCSRHNIVNLPLAPSSGTLQHSPISGMEKTVVAIIILQCRLRGMGAFVVIGVDGGRWRASAV
eukprot:11437442-Heterocapsa_arctica.AAC.1